MGRGEKKRGIRGLFMVFEGIDGSGKTTQARKLADHLNVRNIPCLETREPSDSPVGLRIRELLVSGTAAAEELAEAFIADRKLHLETEIIPALEEGKHVICDRYFYSNIAYQGASGLDVEKIRSRNREFLKPDYIFFFQVSVAVALERVRGRNEISSIYEKRAFLDKVEAFYRELQESEENAFVLNGEIDEETLHRQICLLLGENEFFQ